MNLPSLSKILCLFCLSYFPLSAVAVTDLSITDEPDTVAIVNGYKLPLASVDLVYQSVSQGKRPMRYEDLVNGLIENRLLSEYAEKNIGAPSLMGNNPVGFPVQVYLDDQYIGLIQSAFHKPLSTFIQSNMGDSPASITSFYLDEKRELLSRVLDMKSRMEYRLTPAEQHEAEQLILANFTLPGEAKQSVTLLALYKRQNVQGRIKIHQLDMAFITDQINQLVSSAAVGHWARQYSGLTGTDIDALKQFIKDRHYKTRVIAYHGVSEDIHDDNPVLDEAFKQVTQDEIKQYYRAHKEKFKRIEYVEARHIRLADQDSAQLAMAALDDGMTFSEAAKKFSIADTKNKKPAGSLGGVRADESGNNWAKSVVFAIKQGVKSRPIRSPQADGKTVYWEIFLVDKREENYFDVNSETVRYLAGKEVARKNLEQQFLSVRKVLFETAVVQVNPALIGR